MRAGAGYLEWRDGLGLRGTTPGILEDLVRRGEVRFRAWGSSPAPWPGEWAIPAPAPRRALAVPVSRPPVRPGAPSDLAARIAAARAEGGARERTRFVGILDLVAKVAAPPALARRLLSDPRVTVDAAALALLRARAAETSTGLAALAADERGMAAPSAIPASEQDGGPGGVAGRVLATAARLRPESVRDI